MTVYGIDPKVDIAFKRVFGRTEGRDLTISLINAVLQPTQGQRVVELELLDPYNEQEALDDKLTILDLKARDERRRLFDVEMQMNLVPSLAERLLYYWSQLYSRQLASGEAFTELRPAISICFLNQVMFPSRRECHNVFGLWEREGELCLTDNLKIHVLELPKFRGELETLSAPLDVWLYFFQNGDRLDADALPPALASPEISQAMEVLKVFTQSDVERDRYENRLKALRDQRGYERQRDEALRAQQEALQQRDQAMEERDQVEDKFHAHLSESEQQRQEAELEIKQGLIKRIQLSQRLLGQPAPPTDHLLAQPLDHLRTLAAELEQKLPSE